MLQQCTYTAVSSYRQEQGRKEEDGQRLEGCTEGAQAATEEQDSRALLNYL